MQEKGARMRVELFLALGSTLLWIQIFQRQQLLEAYHGQNVNRFGEKTINYPIVSEYYFADAGDL